MHDIVQPTGQRTSGLLLHLTSLPGRYGIGDLGAFARQFVDFLVASGQQYWQVLPLGPPDEVYSPYQGASSMAGNTLLLSLDTLVTEGWLPQKHSTMPRSFQTPLWSTKRSSRGRAPS